MIFGGVGKYSFLRTTYFREYLVERLMKLFEEGENFKILSLISDDNNKFLANKKEANHNWLII